MTILAVPLLTLLLAVPPAVEVPSSMPPRAVESPTKAEGVEAGRLDLGRGYLRLEAWLAANPPSPEARREANRRFDALTMLFFAGRFGAAVRAVADLEADLRGLTGEARERFLDLSTRRIEVVPTVFETARPASISLREQPILGRGEDLPGSIDLASLDCTLRGPHDRRLPSRVTADGALVLGDPSVDLIPGRWTLEWSPLEGSTPLVLASIDVVDGDLESRRRDLEARLAGLPATTAPADLDAVRSRLGLLGGEATESSARWLEPAESLLDELDEEIARLERGERAYAGVVGDHWRTISLGAARMPVRVVVPASVRARGTPAPVVIALHGAGGDENMFLEGYGAGAIVELAESHGFVLASPLTTMFAFGGMLEPLLAELEVMAPIDRGRVMLLGHSMGAAAALRIAQTQRDRIAAVALLAGAGAIDLRRPLPPTLVVVAELDPLASPARVLPGVERAREAGLDVEWVEAQGSGHTLVVGERLGEVVPWLLDRASRTPASPAAPITPAVAPAGESAEAPPAGR